MTEKQRAHIVENFESVVDYNTVLDDFEGPLDLLLHLINIAQINIEDVFVSRVTEQFLDYIAFMNTQKERDVDKESEYLALAAQIIYIKSKSLVPVIEEYADDGAEEEERALIEQLRRRELELIKGETPKLKERETFGYIYKEPDPSVKGERIVYKDFTFDRLVSAYAELLLRAASMQREKLRVREIPKDAFTVEEKVAFIRERLAEEESLPFEALFPSCTVSELVTAFSAVLEMLKLQYINLDQTENFGKITIKRNPAWNLEEIDSDKFDEYD